MTILRNLQNRIADRLINSFSYWQERGVHIIPNRFDQPVPDTSTLKPEIWERQSQLPGIRMNESAQLELLAQFAEDYKSEYELLPRDKTPVPHQYFINNGSFVSVDGEILYCMVRHFKPRKIFEIGSGNSTYLAAQAILKNEEEGGHACQLTAFEPYPNQVLRAGFPGLARLETTQAQQIPIEKFDELSDGDILFIDSSHVLKLGSDVQYLFLEVLPRLRRGVLVHVHDIFLPAEYPRDWIMRERWFWNEQYLLQAFLIFNDSFDVYWAGYFMHLNQSAEMARAFASYDREESWPGSFWMRKIK
jgi:predicted O-methyltransferase YrrM